MSFFITSAGSGKGADLGGLAGADAQCQRLARRRRRRRQDLARLPEHAAARCSGHNPAVPGTHARDRIGKGPWYNAKGELIARDLAHLHNGNNISKDTALDETRQSGQGPRRDAQRARHPDRLARRRHRLRTADRHHVRRLDQARRRLGHRRPPRPRRARCTDNWSTSWNFSHQRAGCSQEALVRTGGAGRFYCFAANRAPLGSRCPDLGRYCIINMHHNHIAAQDVNIEELRREIGEIQVEAVRAGDQRPAIRVPWSGSTLPQRSRSPALFEYRLVGLIFECIRSGSGLAQRKNKNHPKHSV